MAEESTTPDLEELYRRAVEAYNRRDFDDLMSYFASDAVWETVPLGSRFEGVAAVRDFLEDWVRSYDEYVTEPEEILDLGGDVVSAVTHQEVRLAGSDGRIRPPERFGYVFKWMDGLIVLAVAYGSDINEARAAAERLAEERG
jgi:ketosteroid isomerase-like protein